MKKNILLCFFLYKSGFSQNLIQNPGFETISSCPTALSQINLAPSWNLSSANNFGTPDLYNNGGTCSYMPTNSGQGAASANSGNGFVGMFFYRTGGIINREYLVAPLSSPMVAGTNYTLIFHVRKSTSSRWSVDEIGAYFSTAAPPCTNTSAPCSASSVLMGVTPQVKTPTGVFPDNNWQQVALTLTATAAWEYVTIGNFDTDAATGKMDFSPTPSIGSTSYLLFDDFVLAETSILSSELNYFKSNCKNNKNVVSWEYALPNYGKITLESSENAKVFEEIEVYDANGQTNFEYIDMNSYEGKIYRVKQTDKNGVVNYSNIIASVCWNDNLYPINVYPNPASSKVKVKNAPEGAIIQLKDLLGRILESFVSEGEDIIVIDLEKYQEGVYFISVNSYGNFETFKQIVKRN